MILKSEVWISGFFFFEKENFEKRTPWILKTIYRIYIQIQMIGSECWKTKCQFDVILIQNKIWTLKKVSIWMEFLKKDLNFVTKNIKPLGSCPPVSLRFSIPRNPGFLYRRPQGFQVKRRALVEKWDLHRDFQTLWSVTMRAW